MEYILILIGFALLLYSGKFLVKGSVSLASQFKISKLVIGVTVVSFGTSAPEMFVSALANFKGFPNVAMGNVMGSNIANIALVLAITAIIIPIPVKKDSVKIDAPFMLLVSGILYLAILSTNITTFEGVAFLLLLTTYLFFIIRKSRRSERDEEQFNEKPLPIWKAVGLVLLSTAGLAFGSDLLVDNASLIAANFGVSERVIGITVIAFGTSLPELATSAVAAFRKEMDISIGNIIGSNIFNILAVLGVTALIKPVLNIDEKFIQVDIFWMLAISILLFLFILPFKGGKLTRLKGFILFAVYCTYIYFLL
jgi:cation:H+ antiporter